MIVTRLSGGLGNQMFQYAFGRRTAVNRSTKLSLDVSQFGTKANETPRDYALTVFKLTEEPIQFTTGVPQRSLLSLPDFCLPYYSRRYVKQRGLVYDPQLLDAHDNTYLDGYWQSYRYFQDIAGVVRHDFAFKQPANGKNQKLIDSMKHNDSVAIHVRRGDYVSDPKTNQYHGVLGMEYYAEAVGRLSIKVNKPTLYVFSDDLAWAKKHFNFVFPIEFVSHNRDHAAEDLRLMTYCKHHIIANSTFSWWGAWLAVYPHKNVFAPSAWFRQTQQFTDSLLPPDWIRV